MSESTLGSLTALEPRPVWEQFDAIRRIPRPSRREERIAEHVRSWAAGHAFAVRADAAGNLVVVVPASAGREDAETVVLQAHLDMVCEKNAGVDHDFDRDPIAVAVDGDWVRARGTTLGADNGIGVAAAMAAAVDPEVEHGPLELLFTLDEETGLNGALAFDPAIVEGRLLLNLDTEEDDAIYIGCAGAGGVLIELDVERAAAPVAGTELCELFVSGLRGGHSGVDIHENRGNAIKIAVRVLLEAVERGIDFDLVILDGGSKANAIPREGFAQLSLTPAARAAFEALLTELRRELEADFGTVDPELRVALREPPEACEWPPLAAADRDRLLRLLSAAPHGVIAMSREVPGLVETSNNVAVVRTDEDLAGIELAFRSSVNAALASTGQALRSLARLSGGEVTTTRGYPGWKPEPDSPLVKRTAAVYERLFGAEPGVEAIHAGIECGLLVEKVPGLAAVSIGPEIRDPHSPSERVRISSVAKFYRFLQALLVTLSA
ncbi:MAG: beta-Ala-His dipeptidase [Thermoanaerobaculia bacterium]